MFAVIDWPYTLFIKRLLSILNVYTLC